MTASPAFAGPTTNPVRAWVAAALVVLLMIVIGFEYTLVFPAMTILATTFQVTSIVWAITIVSLVGAAICPLAGKLGDRYGKKPVILAVAGCISVGNLVCALTSSYTLFLVGRGLQGVGAALSVLAYAYLRDVMPPKHVAMGLGATAAGWGLSAVVGPFISAWLLGPFGYQGLFWFLLIYVVVVGGLFAVVAPGRAAKQHRSLDVLSAALLGFGFGALLLAVSQGPVWGFLSPLAGLTFLVGLVLIGCAVARLLSTAEPLVDLRHMVGPRMRLTVLYVLMGNIPATGFSFFLPLMVQTRPQEGIAYGLGFTPLAFALLMLPYGMIALFSGLLGGFIARIRNPRLVARLGAGVMAAAALGFSLAHTEIWQLVVWTSVYGLGFAFYYCAYPNLLAQAVPANEMASTSGVVNVVNALGSAAAVTIAGVILAANVLRLDEVTGATVFSEGGFAIGWLFLAGGALVALVAALVMRNGTRPAQGQEVDLDRPEHTDRTAVPV
jgi:MFS family permease